MVQNDEKDRLRELEIAMAVIEQETKSNGRRIAAIDEQVEDIRSCAWGISRDVAAITAGREVQRWLIPMLVGVISSILVALLSWALRR